MKAIHLIILASMITLSSCNNAELERLKAENQELIERSEQKSEDIDLFITDLNEISDGIRRITDREDLLLGMTIDDAELNSPIEDRIKEDLEMIDELILENKDKILSLEKKVKKGTGRIQEFERIVANLKMDILDKENSITILRAEFEELEGDYADLLSDYYDQALIARIQDTEMHKAWFAFGSKQELEEMEVVEKVGGVIGIGSTHKLKDDFNKDYFTEVDIRELETIPLETKSVSMVSSHPEESYHLVTENELVKEIRITDPDAFWSGSRYLAMVVK